MKAWCLLSTAVLYWLAAFGAWREGDKKIAGVLVLYGLCNLLFATIKEAK